MSLLSSIKNLVIEDDKPKVAPPEAPPVAQPSWGGQASSGNPPQWGASAPRVVKVIDQAASDPKIRALLETDVNQAAKPAFSEFTITASAMADIIPDERTRFQAAMKTIIARGLTREQVLIDIDECLQALTQKESENKTNAAKAREQKVGTKATKLAAINTQLEDLRQQITAGELERDRLQEDIAKDTASIEQIEASFNNEVAQFRQDLLDRKSKITSLTAT